ncbi:MAG: hypothetical protein D6791_08260 [Chloroflexi bacterium]|nr:MAG: hypothetical protein D6791_08260 [Chloroflexota bacterium]
MFQVGGTCTSLAPPPVLSSAAYQAVLYRVLQRRAGKPVPQTALPETLKPRPPVSPAEAPDAGALLCPLQGGPLPA